MAITPRSVEIQIPFLARVSRSNKKTLFSNSTVSHVAAGVQLLEQGKIPEHVLFPLDEPIELFACCGTKTSVIALSPACSPLILAAAVRNAPCLMSARTIAATRVLFIRAEHFRSILHYDPALALATADELSRGFRVMVRQVRWQKLRTATTRLAAYLLQQCPSRNGSATITLEISKRLLASLLGLEPESLSRCFTALAPHGVQVSGDVITVGDLERLRAVAAYDRVIDDAE